MKSHIAIYARVSTDDQNLDSQLAECRAWCKQHAVDTPVVLYQDKISGSAVSRDALNKMMDAVRKGKVSTVVSYKLDRLGRSLVHLAQMVGEFDSHKVAVVCPTQGIDTRTSNPAGRLQMHVLMAMAEFERSLIRERTLAGLANARAKGKVFGRPRGSRLNLPVDDCRNYIAGGGSIWQYAKDHGLSESSLRRALAA